ncbi:glutamate racemase [Lipingzhangella halophila]|uniref:Glutamate racemase n=1 Tax=Lipingzhangella halophila TaxID=1783352 RepID=A0A7W7RJI2_9ACTN|nr:aspartate/glutamate racemase family protein [Lipingzhangella halophila]MBB4933137.1 glutamate racemase [Lipingzhangella halophila]
MRIALVDSGIGMLSTAAALRRARPDADLVLSMDPDHMPWGLYSADEVIGRALAGARAGSDPLPDAIVVPCNTASVHGLDALRAEFEPRVPVVGTVPPIKPAAAAGEAIAVWATAATTRSRYQTDLIERFAPDIAVTQVACIGLAEAIESADADAIADAVSFAAERTPADVTGVVLGCTHYDLVSERIDAALGRRAALFTADEAVCAQTLRRLGAGPRPDAPRTGTVRVLRSGRPDALPDNAVGYHAGAALALPPEDRTVAAEPR